MVILVPRVDVILVIILIAVFSVLKHGLHDVIVVIPGIIEVVILDELDIIRGGSPFAGVIVNIAEDGVVG